VTVLGFAALTPTYDLRPLRRAGRADPLGEGTLAPVSGPLFPLCPGR